MTMSFHTFADAPSLALALARDVAAALAQAIALRGKASIAVSGGSTPKRFFEELSKLDIDWPKVTVTLVDERNVPVTSDRSNHRLVAASLLQDKAASAHFIPLYHEAADADAAAALATRALAGIAEPFDVVVLGMGNDGHTASFFPGGNHLAKALDPDTDRGVMTMQADGAGEERLTLTYSALQDARMLVLHVEGQSKKDTLDRAMAGKDEAEMPIRAMLNRASSPVEIYWAP